jgi:hypothetical protein
MPWRRFSSTTTSACASTRAQRNADLAALGLGLGPHHPQHVLLPALETTAPYGEDAAAAHHPGKGHIRKRSKEQHHLQLEQQQQGPQREGLDETLLTVIGILHTARLQSSIAGLLRTHVGTGRRVDRRSRADARVGTEWSRGDARSRAGDRTWRQALRFET